MLKQEIRRRGLTYAQAGRQLRTTEMTIWRICAGRSMPGKALMRRIFLWSKGRLRPDHFYDLSLPKGRAA